MLGSNPPKLNYLKKRKRLNAGTAPANKEYTAGTVPANMEYAACSLSNVRRCWLAMPLGAGILSWVLACRTIEKNKSKIVIFSPQPLDKTLALLGPH